MDVGNKIRDKGLFRTQTVIVNHFDVKLNVMQSCGNMKTFDLLHFNLRKFTSFGRYTCIYVYIYKYKLLDTISCQQLRICFPSHENHHGHQLGIDY